MAQQFATNIETSKSIREFGRVVCKEAQNDEGQRCPRDGARSACSRVARPQSPRPDPVEVPTYCEMARRNLLDTFQVPT